MLRARSLNPPPPGTGLALMHSHPLGEGWQGMSFDDVKAERGHAGAVLGATRMPIIGMTLAWDGAWSGRFWIRTAPRIYARHNCATIRVVGDRLTVHCMDELAPPPLANGEQIRTISVWGKKRSGISHGCAWASSAPAVSALLSATVLPGPALRM